MQPKKIVNIVNFIRSEDWREDPKELNQTFLNQLELCKKYPMPYTFLMLYDAILKPEYVNPLLENTDPNMEVGLWLELSREAVERAGIHWDEPEGRTWTWHVHPGMLTGYTIPERARIIDELMERFRSVFGHYPESVGCWIVDTFTVRYLKEKYDIKAICICKEQYGTDGYTLWGGYYNQGYYPSKKNMFMPAQTKAEQMDVPVFRMLGPDPIYQYESALDENYNASALQQVVTMEPCWHHGQNENWVDWYLNANFCEEAMSFAYTQTGQENSFLWKTFGKALEMQLNKIYDGVKQNKWEVLSVAQTGAWFSQRYDMTPATSMTALTDWKQAGNQTVWYDCKNYRMNLHNKAGYPCIRDLFLFDENHPERYNEQPVTGARAVFDALPVIDGYRWGGNGIHSAMYFVKPGTEEKVKGHILSVTSENGSTLKITLELAGEEVICVCDENGVRLMYSNTAFDLLFRYQDLCDTRIAEIRDNAVVYEHDGARYGISLSCSVSGEDKGFRISPQEGRFTLRFVRER